MCVVYVAINMLLQCSLELQLCPENNLLIGFMFSLSTESVLRHCYVWHAKEVPLLRRWIAYYSARTSASRW